MNRIYAIGDIHGRFDLLSDLMNKLEDDQKLDLTKDKLVFLGDMIDRGPESSNVLRLIWDLQKEHPKNVIVLLGNHEDMMLWAFKGRPHAKDAWYINGGNETVKSFQGWGNVTAGLLAWLDGLPLSHEEPGFFFSHAPVGLWEEKPFRRDALLWDSPSGSHAKQHKDMIGKDLVGVCGHRHDGLNEEPRFYDHYIYVDTGCGCSFESPLSAVEVISRKVIQVRESVLHPEQTDAGQTICQHGSNQPMFCKECRP